ncbi:MAG TPA: TIGR01777 family oxidoreductase, partial [Candidatus Thalassarchaeaceae archaeon]|nr:TIGR01777 family oxidoreductase [Candidatus Thalassarchaeaceae archaeon]
TDLIEGELFADRMIRGPFKRWEHTHRLKEENGTTIVRDEVSYDVPFGFLGRLFGSRYVRTMVTRMFTSREISLIRDIKRHQSFSHLPRKKILISGASGLIGSQLMPFLDTGGHEIIQLVRRKPTNDCERFWDPQKEDLDPSLFDGIDAVIHLGGVGIGDKRWSKKRKAAILDSRRDSVTLLAKTMASLVNKPEVFIVASAIGIYGNRGDENIDENSGNGEGFLTDTALIWESSADAARAAGIRTIHLRSGIVLTPQGGALGRMLFPFKMGAGGPIGSGKQWMSWISMDDHIAAVQHLMMTSECEGAYNLTAPNPVRQKMFAKTLGRVLRRPSFAPLPGFILRILFGELARPLLLEGQKVHPTRLIDAGFEFEHLNLEDALRDALGKWKSQ